ncbi:MAG: L-arabinose ABC transporter ATP-binding protein AraG [Planctomycetota bacterium]|jgi:L-arabinose transport system ATP-binding protein|nr:L-arabinose ABC transporter ATP-binding protein AraG [Planctomycetota bacterium]
MEFVHISKQFPGVLALDDIDFGVPEGSVRALVGENGAGKSTLLKILSGAHPPTSGHIRIADKNVVFENTADAIDAGVAVIYQELQLVPELSIAENIYLGHLPAGPLFIDYARLWENAVESMHTVGLGDVSPKVRVGRLSIGQRQMVEIAKALTRNAGIIAFDEPTSSLSSRETDVLFGIIRKLREQRKTIFYVSHRLEEIFEICDSVTVFRDGRHVSTRRGMEGLTRDMIVKDMVGREIVDIYHYQPRPLGEVALKVENVTGPGLNAPVSFEVRKGEIVGCFGLVGAGRTELMRVLFGVAPRASGSVELFGLPVDIKAPADAIQAGIMLCPEDRKKEGVIPVLSIQENTNISARRHHLRMGFLDQRWEYDNVMDKIRALSIKTPSQRQLAKNLSGGNQQKVVLARWLAEKIKVILLDEPTRGIDVGAKSEIYDIIYRLAGEGIAVVSVSSELPEVLGVSDRILVFSEGELVADVPRAEASQEKILSLALPQESKKHFRGGEK